MHTREDLNGLKLLPVAVIIDCVWFHLPVAEIIDRMVSTLDMAKFRVSFPENFLKIFPKSLRRVGLAKTRGG